MSEVSAAGYIIVKGTRGGGIDQDTGLRKVRSAKIVAARQTQPRGLDQDEVLLRLSIKIPTRAFDPIIVETLEITERAVLDRHHAEADADGDDHGEN